MAANKAKDEPLACGCPSHQEKTFDRVSETTVQEPMARAAVISELRQWPVQIKLVAPNAPFLQGADVLVAATCSAFSNANVHQQFMKNKVTLIGCPKLDYGRLLGKTGRDFCKK